MNDQTAVEQSQETAVTAVEQPQETPSFNLSDVDALVTASHRLMNHVQTLSNIGGQPGFDALNAVADALKTFE